MRCCRNLQKIFLDLQKIWRFAQTSVVDRSALPGLRIFFHLNLLLTFCLQEAKKQGPVLPGPIQFLTESLLKAPPDRLELPT